MASFSLQDMEVVVEFLKAPKTIGHDVGEVAFRDTIEIDYVLAA